MPAATELAAEATAAADAPAGVLDRTRRVIADVLATAVSGIAFDDVAAARGACVAGDGPSTVIGRRPGAAPMVAALVNAMPIAREQLQDGHRRARGHPGSHVVPAVLAVAEPSAATGRQVLLAVLAGYQVGARIGVAMGGTAPGVHDIATWGTVGAAAGVGHLLSGGDREVTAAAIELAASVPVAADAATVFGGASGQHLFLGIGAQLGVLHGQGAAAGLRAPDGTLERHFAPRLAAAPDGVARIVRRVGADWLIDSGYLKRHPTCGLLHGVNDAVEAVVAEHGRQPPEAIAAVEVQTYRAASVFDAAEPRSDLAARFSIPWTVAAGLSLGDLDPAFTAEALRDPGLRALADRVRVRHVASLDAGYPAGRPSIVAVRHVDGQVWHAAADLPRGDGPDALRDPDVLAKPRRLLDRAGGSEWSRRLLEAVGSLGTEPGAGRPVQLFELLRTASVPPTGTISDCK